jgi:C1A family cysteine protease
MGYEQEPSAPARREALKHKIVQYWRCPGLRAIKVSLAQGYPVIGGFSVPESIDSEVTQKTGIVAYPNPSEGFVGGHAVLFVGYDDATKLLKFENSWGTSWGDKGFGYLPYKYVETWLASDFWTIRKSTEV